MKRLFLAVALLSSITPFSQAQDGFGITGGVNLSTLKFSASGSSITPDRAPKIALGINYTSQISDQLYMRMELLFDQRGYKPDDGTVDKISLNYLSLPLMLQYWGSERFNIHAGFELAYLAGGNEVDGVNVADDLTKFDIAFGVGTEFMFSESVGLGFRYLPGLTNILEEDGGTGLTIKNDNIRIYAIIKF